MLLYDADESAGLREFIFILPSRQSLILLFIVPRMTPITTEKVLPPS
jgi:hypothetical protein